MAVIAAAAPHVNGKIHNGIIIAAKINKIITINSCIAPTELAKKHIEMIEYNDNDIWYDPFKNSGNYYNNFPNDNKLWSEILDGKDFFDFSIKK